MTEIIRSDAATLAAKVAARELSSTEITQACLDQIEATDDRYRAFLHVAADEALAAARARSAATCTNAWMGGSTSAILARCASVTSAAETSPSRIAAAISAAVSLVSSVSMR